MNNGQPPYGDPSMWGNQPANGQTPQQMGFTGQAGYGQQPYGNQPMAGSAPYAGQPYEPYGQPTMDDQPLLGQQPMVGGQYGQYGQYSQPMIGNQPMMGNQPASAPQQPQTYQPQAHQPQVYDQQSWQPYAQPAPQPSYQPYAANQQGYQQQAQMQYPQFNQQGQPVYPNQGYSGYVSQPQQKKKQGFPADVIAKVVLFGVLPVLFVLGLVLGSVALKWVFLGTAVAAIIAMWMTDLVSPNVRLTMSLVYGALAVVAMVSALSGPTPDVQNPAQSQGSYVQQNQGSYEAQQEGNASSGQLVWHETPSPTITPTQTPDPYTVAGAAVEQLQSFFYFWAVNNDENMVALTAPSWRRSVEDPQKALFNILVNRTPDQDYEITNITGTENDTTRTATVKVTIDKHNGRAKERYSFKIIMLKEDGTWYVDPRSLESHDKETATPATVNTTPTQPPLYTGTPNTILYYNPDGGSLYHLDQNCKKVGKAYKPLKGSFYFSQITEAPYNELTPCNVCGAPIPE